MKTTRMKTTVSVSNFVAGLQYGREIAKRTRDAALESGDPVAAMFVDKSMRLMQEEIHKILRTETTNEENT